ncbi:unnamed protein product, partial [Owenia fusiformis]
RECLDDGTWSGEAPTCAVPVSCPNPTVKPNTAIVALTGNSVGDIVEYTCDDTFVLSSGDLRRECLDDGTWSGEAPTCAVPVSCPNPTVKPNTAIVAVTGNRVGDTVE